MGSSVLSIRKALYNSYQNESFKLKERQRHAMAKQRRDQMESDRIYRNRINKILEKEKEISKRYERLKKPNERDKNSTMFFPAEIYVSGRRNEQATQATDLYQSDRKIPRKIVLDKSHYYAEQNNSFVAQEPCKRKSATNKDIREEKLTFPAINCSRWDSRDTGHMTGVYKSECRMPRESTLTKPCLYAETNSRVNSDSRRPEQVHKNEMVCTPPSSTSSAFANDLINYYRDGDGLRSNENDRTFGKKTNVS